MCLKSNSIVTGNRHRIVYSAYVAISCAILTRSALAGSPPLITDDPETPGYGGWEINFTSSIEHSHDGTTTQMPLFDINYGLSSDRDQLKLEFAVASNDPEDAGPAFGMSDFSLGYKYRFLEAAENHGWAVSIYPQVSAPTGDEARGLGSGETELLIPFEFQKSYFDDKLWLNPEIGYNITFDHHSPNGWKLGLAMGYEFPNEWEIQGEIGAFVFQDDRERDNPFFNVGFAHPLTKNLVLVGSAGRSLRPSHDGTPDFFGLIGIQLLFGAAAQEEHPAHEEGGDKTIDLERGDPL
jgi:hypothetical protein